MAATLASLGRPPVSTRRLVLETVIVLSLSLGRSAVYAILSILDSLTRPEALNEQTVILNPSVTPDRPWLDLSYQVVGVVFGLAPVLLACYLVSQIAPPRSSWWLSLGLDGRRRRADALAGVGLAALIGVPGLLFYLASVRLGVNLNVSAANLTANWWTIPVYVARALMNGLLEEVLMVGYLFTRWSQAGLRSGRIIWLSAAVRGLYHLYQGFGGMIGNLVMGLVLGVSYQRTRRLWPLVIAHTLLDVVAFVGYSLLKDRVGWL